MWGGTDEAQSIATIGSAIDRGVTLIHIAPIYGFGRSEEIGGKDIDAATKHRRSGITGIHGAAGNPTEGAETLGGLSERQWRIRVATQTAGLFPNVDNRKNGRKPATSPWDRVHGGKLLFRRLRADWSIPPAPVA